MMLNKRTATHVWETPGGEIRVPVFMYEPRQAIVAQTPAGDVDDPFFDIANGAGFELVLNSEYDSIVESAPIVPASKSWLDLRSETHARLFLLMPALEKKAVVLKLMEAVSHEVGVASYHDKRYRDLIAEKRQVLVLMGMGLDIDPNTGEANLRSARDRGSLVAAYVKANV